MNESLEKYKDEQKIWCINGMALNPECLKIPEDYPFDTYFNYRNSSHGWASWSDRWAKAIWNHGQIKYELSNYKQQLLFNRGGNDMYPMMQAQFDGNIDSWAIRWSYSISRNNGICLTPKYSLVTAQASAEGTHIKGNNKLIDNDLSLSVKTVIYPDTLVVNQEIAKRFALNFNPNIPELLNGDEHRLNEIKFSSNYKVEIIGFTKAGGAGIAADRLHQGLLNDGVNSSFINYDAPDCKSNHYRYFDNKKNRQAITNFAQFTNQNIYSGNTIFSLSHPSLSFSDLEIS